MYSLNILVFTLGPIPEVVSHNLTFNPVMKDCNTKFPFNILQPVYTSKNQNQCCEEYQNFKKGISERISGMHKFSGYIW